MMVASAARPVRPEQRGYIPALDGWRAVAILLVIGSHTVWMLLNNGSRSARLLAAALDHAGYGVDVFFALSGFLISTLLLRERARSGTISLRAFYIRRIFRIIPPMLVYLAVILALAWAALIPSLTREEVLRSLLFVKNGYGGGWYTGHFWSLSIEEQFYAVIPLLLLLAPRRGMMRLTIAAIIACNAIRGWEFAHADLFTTAIQFRTENRIDALLWGSLWAQWREARGGPALPRGTWGRIALPTLFVLGMIAVAMLPSSAGRRALVAALLPVMIVYTVEWPGCAATSLLETRPLKFVGRISYSLYLWQMPFLLPFERTLGVVQAFPLALVMPFVCACASYQWVEKPMIALGHRLSAGIRQRDGLMADKAMAPRSS